ncbi:RHS repeat-associated core domain-containing protein, partial [Shewanella inventionis]|uniref:RHS repeat-associated core domain-containing protein n=2 Tax=Shewanella inventionis TaxID=1738770 RepID=UPI001E52F48D
SSNAYYYVRTTVTGNPTQEVYFDKWGREVIAQTTSFSGGWNKVIKEYDGQGREFKVYEPNSTDFTQISYDELNRPNIVTKPNGTTVTNGFYGFESRTTNEVGVTSSSYQNGFGETVYTQDAIGNTVSFTYDAQGNVVTTDTTGEGSNYIVTVTYDDWGRKLSTNDPSKGLWKYTYNAFGELMTQETARGHTFTFSYDLLGRKIKSYEPSEGTLCWNYGTTTDKGRLLSVEKFDAAVATCATGNPTYKNSFTYYPDGLVKTTTTLIDGNTFTQSQSYDSYSRPSITTYPTGTAAFSVKNNYTTSGYLSEVRNNVTSALLKRVDSMTARNQVDKVTYGNNVSSTAVFEDDTGWLSSIDVKNGAGIQLTYTHVEHDDVGNVASRWTKFGSIPGSITDFTETYGYDYLTNRLEDRTISIATGSGILPTNFKTYQDFNYDDWGNIKFKTGVGNYNYYATKPHQLNEVKSASGAQLYKFFYDANGNSKTDGTRTFNYGSYDKPTLITKAGSSSSMKYGPERELIYKSDTYVENGKNVTYQTTYLGNYEKVYRTGGAGTLTEHKFYVGDIVFTQRSNGSSDTFYLHKDHQGSVIATTNASGAVVSQAIYDPWGKRTAVYLHSTLASFTTSEPTDRGYTGHKHIKDLDIIHMGGRIYDPTLGRFLQADPFIQAPLNSQSYNRYAYVLNNPMSMTDPSGYFFSGLKKFVKKWWKPIVAVVAVVATYGAATNWVAGWGATWGTAATATSAATLTTTGGIVTGAIAGGVGGFVGGALMTGSLKGSLTGALKGAFSGAIFGGIAAHYGNTWNFSRVMSNSVAGGISGEATGGSFREGFKLSFALSMTRLGWEHIKERTNMLKLRATKIEGNRPPVYNKHGELMTYSNRDMSQIVGTDAGDGNWFTNLTKDSGMEGTIFENKSSTWARSMNAISKGHDFWNSDISKLVGFQGYDSMTGMVLSGTETYNTAFQAWSLAGMVPTAAYTGIAMTANAPYIYDWHRREYYE